MGHSERAYINYIIEACKFDNKLKINGIMYIPREVNVNKITNGTIFRQTYL